MTLDELILRVAHPAVGDRIYYADSDMAFKNSEAAHCLYSVCQPQGQTATDDMWIVGLISLRLLLGRPCHECEIVNEWTGNMPMLPMGISLKCMDCLAPKADDCVSINGLFSHDCLHVTHAPPHGPTSSEDSLATDLLLSHGVTKR